MKKILFVGSHLSNTKSTQSMSEKLARLLSSDFKVELVSKYQNKLLRLIDILLKSLFYKYDIIHIDVYSGFAQIYAFFSALIARVRNKEIIITLHGGRLSEYYGKHPMLLSFLFNNASVITSPSKFLVEFFNYEGVVVRYIPNFISLEKFNYKQPYLDSPKLLWVRAFDKYYNPQMAIDTIRELLNDFPTIKLTMVGPDKGMLAEIMSYIAKKDLHNTVDVIGPIPNQELSKFFHTHSVFLNTTSYESFGVAVLEAASSGIPIVSSAVGEIPFLWEDKRDIFLVDNLDYKGMSLAVKTILNAPKIGVKLSENAKFKANFFDQKLIKRKWLELISLLGDSVEKK
jgi:glycosyltransferase involved in cell wall biosynthesis